MLTHWKFARLDPVKGKRQEQRSKRALTAKNIIIATVQRLLRHHVECVDPSNCLDSDTALELSRLPKSIIVLGGGATACEFAQFFQRFGVKVTLIQRSSHVLHEFDSDAASELERVFSSGGHDRLHRHQNHRLTEGRVTEGSQSSSVRARRFA